MSATKRSIITAVCIALCVVLPMAFHAIPQGGSIYCPMHIPVLLCGLICGWPFGLLCGIAGPLLSSALTGMPPVAYLPSMVIELAVYGAVSGLVMKAIKTGKLYPDLYISLVSAMLAGRVVGGLANAAVFSRGEYSMTAWASGYFVTGLPGIIIQLALIPSVVYALEKANLVPMRYPVPETEEI